MAGGCVGFTIWLVPVRPLCLHDVGAAPLSCARLSSSKSEIKGPERKITDCFGGSRKDTPKHVLSKHAEEPPQKRLKGISHVALILLGKKGALMDPELDISALRFRGVRQF